MGVENTPVSKSRNFLLRLAALVAAFSIGLLRKELDPRTVFVVLVTFFYVGAYLATAFSRAGWVAFRIGFSAGLSISMCPALFFLLAMNAMAFPTAFPSAPAVAWWAYPAAFGANLMLFGIAIGYWISSRERIANRTVKRYFLLGLAYPYLAFASMVIVAFPFVRS